MKKSLTFPFPFPPIHTSFPSFLLNMNVSTKKERIPHLCLNLYIILSIEEYIHYFHKTIGQLFFKKNA